MCQNTVKRKLSIITLTCDFNFKNPPIRSAAYYHFIDGLKMLHPPTDVALFNSCYACDCWYSNFFTHKCYLTPNCCVFHRSLYPCLHSFFSRAENLVPFPYLFNLIYSLSFLCSVVFSVTFF